MCMLSGMKVVVVGGGGCYTQFMAEKCVQQQDQTKKNEKYHQQINCQLLKGH